MGKELSSIKGFSPQQQRQRAALIEAIATFPTLKAFAAALKLDYRLVQKWRDIRGVVPIEFCVLVELITRRQVKRHRLNEDWDQIVYGKRRA